jgi:hypothetical protein
MNPDEELQVIQALEESEEADIILEILIAELDTR